MMKRFVVFTAVTAGMVVACSDGPTDLSDAAPAGATVVVTEGVPAPAWVPVHRPAASDAAASADLGGSSSTPLAVQVGACAEAVPVTVTYTITGRQVNQASFKVNTTWTYNGASWTGSVPTTVSVPSRAATDAPTVRPVSLTLVNASASAAGSSTFVVLPFDLATTAPAALAVGDADVTLHVAFAPCETPNTPPTLVVPDPITVEATSSAGAPVNFAVTATDLEDGDLTSAVTCDAGSGDTFPLGTTTVECSVTDDGGLTTTGSFTITVEDTTPAHFTNFPTGTVTLIAADIDGAVLDIETLGITAADWNNVSEPATFACDYVAGTVLAIGSTTTVSCTATDAIGNESAPSTFDVFVGLNVNAAGFLPPLRMSAPFSAHKRGSTVPHKFHPPAYADGTPATDLAGGLRLEITWLGGSLPGTEIEVNDYAAGSTAWRYDAEGGHYIFNLKSLTSWQTGPWQTRVSYAGIPLAETEFEFRR